MFTGILNYQDLAALEVQIHLLLGILRFADVDGRYKPVASAAYIHYVAGFDSIFIQSSSKCCDVDFEIASIEEGIGPNARDKVSFADQLAGVFDQHRRALEFYGGEGGIRTLGRALWPYDGLANRCFRPLSHLSVFNSPDFSGFWSMSLHYTAIFALRGTTATVQALHRRAGIQSRLYLRRTTLPLQTLIGGCAGEGCPPCHIRYCK